MLRRKLNSCAGLQDPEERAELEKKASEASELKFEVERQRAQSDFAARHAAAAIERAAAAEAAYEAAELAGRSLAEEKNANLGLFGGACLAVLYYVFVVPLHYKLLIAGVAGLASRAFPALKGALLTNPTNLSVATIVSSLGGDGDASVVALAAVTAATKARARRMSISAVEFAKRNATPHKKKPSAMHAHAE